MMKMNSERVGLLLGAALLVSGLAVVAAPGMVDNGVSAEKSPAAITAEKENPEASSERRRWEREFRVRVLDDSDERARPPEEEDRNH